MAAAAVAAAAVVLFFLNAFIEAGCIVHWGLLSGYYGLQMIYIV